MKIYMNNSSRILSFFCLIFGLLSCNSTSPKQTQSSHVKIVQNKGKFGLEVNGKAYQVKGAGLNFPEGSNFKALAEAGGNTFRTWNTDYIDAELDSAKKYNLMIALGLDLGKELHGFDYGDAEAVKKQFEKTKVIIDAYKDHPNLLCWVAGNELNLLFDEKGQLKLVNPKTYTALAEIVDYIHQVDPNHPVTTTFAGVSKSHIDLALQYCPNLDFLGLQVYGGLFHIQQEVKTAEIMLPFMITEFGPMGHWEMPSTAWGREIEEPSAVKAAGMISRIQKGIASDTTGLNIGAFAFEWGQKQERTPTWYGMFNKSGEASARIDELTNYWTGSYPENRAPLTDSMKLDQQFATENIYLKPNATYSAEVFVRELDGDPLKYEWVILKEVVERSEGGAFEKEPEPVEIEILMDEGGKLSFRTPTVEGDYRLFSYAYDGKGKVGNANVPFFIKK